jgi:hypothetical protein
MKIINNKAISSQETDSACIKMRCGGEIKEKRKEKKRKKDLKHHLK